MALHSCLFTKNDGGEKWHLFHFRLHQATFSVWANTIAKNMAQAQRLRLRRVWSCSWKCTVHHRWNQWGVNTFISRQARDFWFKSARCFYYSWHSWTLDYSWQVDWTGVSERFLYEACCVAKLNGGAGCHLLVRKRVWADILVWCASVKVLQFFDSSRVKIKRSQKDVWQCSSCTRWPERSSGLQ